VVTWHFVEMPGTTYVGITASKLPLPLPQPVAATARQWHRMLQHSNHTASVPAESVAHRCQVDCVRSLVTDLMTQRVSLIVFAYLFCIAPQLQHHSGTVAVAP
jgi:hypothetical protein